MEKLKYATESFKDWDNFKYFISQFSDNWVYRGQSDVDWDLITSLKRTDFLAEKEIPSNIIEWLALMQHHGALHAFLILQNLLILLHILYLS